MTVIPSIQDTLSKVYETAVSDPLFKDFARRTAGKVPMPAVTNPEDVLGERLLYVAEIAKGAIGNFTSPEQRLSTCVALMASSPYLWRTSIANQIMHMPVPRHVISSDVLPEPSMWWTYADSRPIIDAASGSRVGLCHGQIVMARPDRSGIRVIDVGEADGERRVLLNCWDVAFGKVWPSDFASNQVVGVLLASLSFLNSPYIPVRAETMSSALQRALKRDGARPGDVALPVRFIDLRTVTEQGSHEREASGLSGRRMTGRWLVRGHHRAQWYPSQNAHHVIWIAPYIKGKGNGEPNAVVYRVRR